MSREEAKAFLTTLGIEEPTGEQITNFLNTLNGESQKDKDKVKELQDKAKKVEELQKQIDDLNNANLTDAEKASKALEDANKRIAELEKENAIRQQRELAMTNFKITAEQSKEVVGDDGVLNYEALGKIISQKEEDSAREKEKSIANGNNNPGSKSSEKEKTDSEKVVDDIASRIKGNAEATTSIIKNYL